MDKALLVSSGHALFNLLTDSGLKPRAAVWIFSPETGSWRLWIVADKSISDKREFYRRVSEAISKHRDKVPGIDASDTELVKETHPAIVGLSRIVRMEALGSAQFTDTTFNGYHLPDCVVLFMML